MRVRCARACSTSRWLRKKPERSRSEKNRRAPAIGRRKSGPYNFPQNRVTDHRINYTSHDLAAVIESAIHQGGLIEAFKLATIEEQLSGGN